MLYFVKFCQFLKSSLEDECFAIAILRKSFTRVIFILQANRGVFNFFTVCLVHGLMGRVNNSRFRSKPSAWKETQPTSAAALLAGLFVTWSDLWLRHSNLQALQLTSASNTSSRREGVQTQQNNPILTYKFLFLYGGKQAQNYTIITL